MMGSFVRRFLVAGFFVFSLSSNYLLSVTLKGRVFSWPVSDCCKRFKKDIKDKTPTSSEIRELWTALPGSKYDGYRIEFAELLLDKYFDSLSARDIYLVLASDYLFFSDLHKYWKKFIKSAKVKTLTAADIDASLFEDYSYPDSQTMKDLLSAPGVAQNKALYSCFKAWEVFSSYDSQKVVTFMKGLQGDPFSQLSEKQIKRLADYYPFDLASYNFIKIDSLLKCLATKDTPELRRLINYACSYCYTLTAEERKNGAIAFVKSLQGKKQAYNHVTEQWEAINPGLYTFIQATLFDYLYFYGFGGWYESDDEAKQAVSTYILDTVTPLASEDFRAFLEHIPVDQRKASWTDRLIKEYVVEFVATGAMPYYLDYDSQIAVATNILDTVTPLTTKNFSTCLAYIPVDQRKKTWIDRLIKESVSEFLKTGAIPYYLDYNSQIAVATHILDTVTPLGSKDFKKCLAYIPFNQRKQGWKDRLIKEFVLIGLFVKTGEVPTVKGPLFSSYLEKNFDTIYSSFSTTYDDKAEIFEAISKAMADFIEQEYKAGNIVFFHGQQSQWPFVDYITEELEALMAGRTPNHTYVHLRFAPDAGLSDADVKIVRKDGVTWNTFNTYRKYVLFANLHPLANYAGSNSLMYVLSNSDQTANSWGTGFSSYLKDAFTSYGFQNEYTALTASNTNIFIDLFNEYNKAVIEKSNVGRLVIISLPKKLARELAYPSSSGAPLNPFWINGKYTTDVVEIAENFDQVSFCNEYCIILSKTMCDPIAAEKAGIKICGFDVLDHASNSYKQFEAGVKTVIKKVAQLSKKTPVAAAA